MSIPVFSFILGIVLLIFTILVYQGNPLFKDIYTIVRLKKDKLFLVSFSSCSIGLILGIIGGLDYIHPSLLRTIRFFLIAGSAYYLILFFIQSSQIKKKNSHFLVLIF